MNFPSNARGVNELLDLPQVMLDNETMGTAVDAPILAIGATIFTLRDGASPHDYDRIYVPLKLDSVIESGAKCSGSTISWWMEQGEAARSKFFEKEQARAYDLESGLEIFYDWFEAQGREKKQMSRGNSNLKVWGNGPTFDCGMLVETYRRIGEEAPWYYYNEQCMRTITTLGRALGMDPKQFTRVGTHHAALDDAIFQADYVSAVVRKLVGLA